MLSLLNDSFAYFCAISAWSLSIFINPCHLPIVRSSIRPSVCRVSREPILFCYSCYRWESVLPERWPSPARLRWSPRERQHALPLQSQQVTGTFFCLVFLFAFINKATSCTGNWCNLLHITSNLFFAFLLFLIEFHDLGMNDNSYTCIFPGLSRSHLMLPSQSTPAVLSRSTPPTSCTKAVTSSPVHTSLWASRTPPARCTALLRSTKATTMLRRAPSTTYVTFRSVKKSQVVLTGSNFASRHQRPR